ncbi:hypothetical protein ACFY0R_32125 [Streptomyces sp. NPDC001633]|uniref:hypothetical protein n=1 Tax=Streptomyces sp. NPDC001633 TaxID=3364595 RepID=UPI0036AA8043
MHRSPAHCPSGGPGVAQHVVAWAVAFNAWPEANGWVAPAAPAAPHSCAGPR